MTLDRRTHKEMSHRFPCSFSRHNRFLLLLPPSTTSRSSRKSARIFSCSPNNCNSRAHPILPSHPFPHFLSVGEAVSACVLECRGCMRSLWPVYLSESPAPTQRGLVRACKSTRRMWWLSRRRLHGLWKSRKCLARATSQRVRESGKGCRRFCPKIEMEVSRKPIGSTLKLGLRRISQGRQRTCWRP